MLFIIIIIIIIIGLLQKPTTLIPLTHFFLVPPLISLSGAHLLISLPRAHVLICSSPLCSSAHLLPFLVLISIPFLCRRTENWRFGGFCAEKRREDFGGESWWFGGFGRAEKILILSCNWQNEKLKMKADGRMSWTREIRRIRSDFKSQTDFKRVWPSLTGFEFSSGPTRFAEPTRKLVRVCELTREFNYLD